MKRHTRSERNYALVVIAGLVIIGNSFLLAVLAAGVINIGWFGWLVAAGSLSSIIMSTMAIRRNDPTWLLLDLILPN